MSKRIKDSEQRERFKQRVQEWIEKLDIKVRSLSIRSMKHKWASCSSRGNFVFDQGLLSVPPALADYVIVHELLHVSVPNHGKLWKSLMHVHLGDYERLEQKLKEISQERLLSPSK